MCGPLGSLLEFSRSEGVPGVPPCWTVPWCVGSVASGKETIDREGVNREKLTVKKIIK